MHGCNQFWQQAPFLGLGIRPDKKPPAPLGAGGFVRLNQNCSENQSADTLKLPELRVTAGL